MFVWTSSQFSDDRAGEDHLFIYFAHEKNAEHSYLWRRNKRKWYYH